MAIDRNAPRAGRSSRAGRRNRTGRQTRFTPIVPPAEPDSADVSDNTEAPDIAPGVAGDPGVPATELAALGSLVNPELPPGLVTHDDLERHEREAAELHAQAAALRARLDAPPPPIVPRTRRRLPVPLPVAGGLIALVLAALIVAGLRPWSSDAGPQAPGPSPSAAQPADQASDPVPTGLGLPAAGPGISSTGTALGIRMTGSSGGNLGKLRIAQRIVLGPGEVRELVLSQAVTPGLDGDAAQLNPTVSGLKAQVNGAEAGVERDGDAGWTITPTDGQRPRTVLLEYTLGNALALSTPSTSGRALGLVPPLLIESAAPATLVARTNAGQVIGMTCPAAPADQMLCGKAESGGWQATVPADAAAQSVLLQLDLTSS